MDSITSSAKPLCDLCGAEGSLAQDKVSDPDGGIAGDWSFRRCSNTACGVLWLAPAPLETELWKAYASYHTHTRNSSNKLAKVALSLAHRLLKLILFPVWFINGLKREADYLRYMTLSNEPAGKLLDVGCGAGRFLNRMRKRGWDVEGVDFDPQAARKVSERYAIKTHVGDLVACALPAESFDVITMSQAVEHLFDPRANLKECLRILKPGGLLVMTTPNVASRGAAMFGAFWRGWEPPRHLHLFSVASLRQLTEGAGFAVIEARSYSAGSAVVYRVSRANQLARDGVTANPLALLAWSYRQELSEYLDQKSARDTGQNVLVSARKPTQGAD